MFPKILFLIVAFEGKKHNVRAKFMCLTIQSRALFDKVLPLQEGDEADDLGFDAGCGKPKIIHRTFLLERIDWGRIRPFFLEHIDWGGNKTAVYSTLK